MAAVKTSPHKLFIQPHPTVERVLSKRRRRHENQRDYVGRVDPSPEAQRYRYMLAAGWL